MERRTAEQLIEDARQALRETIEATEAAAILGVSPWTIYNLTRRRMIPHIRVSRRVLFRRSSILAWLDERERASMAVEQEPERGRIRQLK